MVSPKRIFGNLQERRASAEYDTSLENLQLITSYGAARRHSFSQVATPSQTFLKRDSPFRTGLPGTRRSKGSPTLENRRDVAPDLLGSPFQSSRPSELHTNKSQSYTFANSRYNEGDLRRARREGCSSIITVTEVDQFQEQKDPRARNEKRNNLSAGNQYVPPLGDSRRTLFSVLALQICLILYNVFIATPFRLMSLVYKKSLGHSGRIVRIGDRTVEKTGKLAEGGYAGVYKCRDVVSGTVYVLKETRCASDTYRKAAFAEWDSLRALPPHPNVVGFFGGCELTKNALSRHRANRTGVPLGDDEPVVEVALLLEYLKGVTLLELVKNEVVASFRKEKRWVLPELRVATIMRDILKALNHLHSQAPAIVHCDIKLENVILASNGLWKICDFNSTCRGTIDTTALSRKEKLCLEETIECSTTHNYRPPEMVDIHRGEPIGPPVDMWMAGCIMFTLIFGRHPFSAGSALSILSCRVEIGDTEAERIALRNMWAWGASHNKHSEDTSNIMWQARKILLDVVFWMLALNPRERLTAAAGLRILDNVITSLDAALHKESTGIPSSQVTLSNAAPHCKLEPLQLPLSVANKKSEIEAVLFGQSLNTTAPVAVTDKQNDKSAPRSQGTNKPITQSFLNVENPKIPSALQPADSSYSSPPADLSWANFNDEQENLIITHKQNEVWAPIPPDLFNNQVPPNRVAVIESDPVPQSVDHIGDVDSSEGFQSICQAYAMKRLEAVPSGEAHATTHVS